MRKEPFMIARPDPACKAGLAGRAPVMDCRKEKNLANCTCSYDPCSRKGICCECVEYHVKNRQLPGCCFPKDAERSYNRSFELFAKLVTEKRV